MSVSKFTTFFFWLITSVLFLKAVSIAPIYDCISARNFMAGALYNINLEGLLRACLVILF